MLPAVAAFAAALVLTGLVRRYALARAVLDVPNERSSHTAPVPRGGGLAIVAVVLGGVALLGGTGRLAGALALAVLGGGMLIAALGWLDDRRGLPALVRLAGHAIAAGWALWWLDGMPTLTIGTHAVVLGAGGGLLAGLVIVWATNVTNFMDGIDGLAAGEAATVTLSAAALLATGNPGLGLAAALTGGAALGFLPWNWRPARIFMGDTGSGFLGYVIAVLAIASERAGALPAMVWLVLYAVFATDATLTLVRRAWRGERWYAPHRSHAYQRLVQAGWSHDRVTGAVLLVNAGLGVVAWWVAGRAEWLGVALAGALAVTVVAYAAVERLRPMTSPGTAPPGRVL